MLAPRDVIRSPRRDRPYRSATPPCGSRAGRVLVDRGRHLGHLQRLEQGHVETQRPLGRFARVGADRRARIQALSVSGRGSASSPPTTPGSLARPSARPPAPTAPAACPRSPSCRKRVPLLVAVRAIGIEAIHQRRAGPSSMTVAWPSWSPHRPRGVGPGGVGRPGLFGRRQVRSVSAWRGAPVNRANPWAPFGFGPIQRGSGLRYRVSDPSGEYT